MQEVKKLKNYIGPTVRDIERQIEGSLDLPAKTDLLTKSKRLLSQVKKSNKLYRLHAPEAYCIAKGKAGKPTSLAARYRWR